MDSVVSNGAVDSLYFRKKLPFTQPLVCNLDSIRLIQWSGIPEFLIDSLIKNSDTTFYYSSQSSLPFYFITSAIVGQSWTITSTNADNDYNEITITCDSIVVENFIGLTDSVKIFSMSANGVSAGQIPIDSFRMKLSKNFGLIEFVPFSRFLYHPFYKVFFTMKLIGIESDSIQTYYQQPTFSDYFDLSPGDILFWDYYIHFNMIPFPNGYHEYYRDSITDVAVFPDSIIYTYDRMIEDTGMVITQSFNRHMYFVRDNIAPLVETAPDWYAYGNIENLNSSSIISNWNQYWSTEAMTITIDSVNGDTITDFKLVTFGASLNPINCYYSESADYYNGITVDSKHGLTSIIIGPESMTLTGSKINGIQIGNITLNIMEQTGNGSAFMIVSNPTTGFFSIQSDVDLKNSEYFIYNYTGKLVDKDKYDGNEIDVSGLTSGLYIVSVSTPLGNITCKLNIQ